MGVTGCGVSILDEGVLRFVTSTSEGIEEVERLQDHFEQRPCKAAASTTTATVVVEDLSAYLERWPKYGPAVVDHGLSAVLGIPMHIDGTTVGALNVYNAAPRA